MPYRGRPMNGTAALNERVVRCRMRRRMEACRRRTRRVDMKPSPGGQAEREAEEEVMVSVQTDDKRG